MADRSKSVASRRVARGVVVSAMISLGIVVFVALAGYFDRDPVHVYPARGSARDIAVVNFSGDMGLRFLLGASTSRGLTEHGYPVVGVATPPYFRRHRTPAEVDAFVADNIRLALRRTGRSKLVVMGQSYGADIVQTGLADLPPELRPRVVAIVLVLPGDTVFFRADPSGLAYRGTPDSDARASVARLTFAPLTCIWGREETDSLCPLVRVPGARLIGMPGGHNIRHDAAGLLGHVLDAIARARAGSRNDPRTAAAPLPPH